MNEQIALIRPFHDSYTITPSLGIGYLSSYLKSKNCSVLLIDALKERRSKYEVLKKLTDNNIKIAGITCLSSYYNEVVELSKLLKKSGITVIIGGVHPTFLPYKTLKETNADYVICGEGEKALYELLKCSGEYIKGVYSLKNLKDENVVFEKTDIVENIDELPFPDWEQIDPKSYPIAVHGTLVKSQPNAVIISSRGCPYSCKFCASNNFYDKKIRFRSPENVVREIKLLSEKFGIKEFQIVDDNFTFDKERAKEICRLIVEEGIKIHWSCPNGIRADKIDDELAGLMKNAGCWYTLIGVESANEAVLRNICKGETIDAIARAIDILHENKIETQGSFILGLPGETEESVNESINFALNSKLNRASFKMLNIFPGSDLWNELKGQYAPSFSGNHFNSRPVWAPEGLTKEYLMQVQNEAHRKFYSRIKILFGVVRLLKMQQMLYFFKQLKAFRLFIK